MALCILRAAWLVYATVSPHIVGVHAPAVVPGSYNCAHLGASWLSCVKILLNVCRQHAANTLNYSITDIWNDVQ